MRVTGQGSTRTDTCSGSGKGARQDRTRGKGRHCGLESRGGRGAGFLNEDLRGTAGCGGLEGRLGYQGVGPPPPVLATAP